jgi:hypothetical protein
MAPIQDMSLHCKDKIPKFWNKYSQKRNIGVSVPNYTFMRLWVIYIFPRLVCLFCWRKFVHQSWDYINRSQTHECRNWGWGRAIPRKGIHKWDFRCSVEPTWRYVKCCRRRCNDMMSIATNENKKELVTKLHISLQLRWRHLTYRHIGCTAMSQRSFSLKA